MLVVAGAFKHFLFLPQRAEFVSVSPRELRHRKRICSSVMFLGFLSLNFFVIAFVNSVTLH